MMGFLSKITDGYDDLCSAIIRPPREHYTIDQLGPCHFQYRGHRYFRKDFSLVNSRGYKLECSHFERVQKNGEYFSEPVPCVVYLHGNCSSRLEAYHCGVVRVLLPLGISVIAFDFSGSGISEGPFVSLGWYEQNDLKCVVNYLRESKRVSSIALWGRSMGAVTAALFAHEDPSIAALILDSPFSSLRNLVEELVTDFFIWKVPKFLLHLALNMVRNSIQAKAAFDLDAVEPIRYCKSSFVPAKNDNFVRPHHAEMMHRAYAGDKNLILVNGGHNTVRPDFLYDSIVFFLALCLKSVSMTQNFTLNESSSPNHMDFSNSTPVAEEF